MHAVHFGAGNIGRGFIGEILAKNGFSIDFIDLNQEVISELNQRNKYTIQLADQSKAMIEVKNVHGINNQKHPKKVRAAIAQADIITTAIGPTIFPYIAELLAQGIHQRRVNHVQKKMDIIACENMIDGSQALFSEVKKYLTKQDLVYTTEMIGFPNAAVDRIVPLHAHEDALFVMVEPFSEWIINETQMKNPQLKLMGVTYVNDLDPYIERKLFSVNTGHATVAYLGAYKGYQTIGEAMADSEIVTKLRAVLEETGNLLLIKWAFSAETHKKYMHKIIERFENPFISDDISRVARTPIRKLGYDERFIRPIRELKTNQLAYHQLLEVVAKILAYKNNEDAQSVQLQKMLQEYAIATVIEKVTNLTDTSLIDEIKQAYLFIR